MKTIKLWYWRRKLKNAYLRHINDRAEYGSTLQDYISGSRLECNRIICIINDLDENANLAPPR